MRILYVGYALEKASGVTTFVERTAEGLKKLGHEVDIIDILKGEDKLGSVGDYDIVHLHCLWQLRRYAKAAREADVPIVWSTHGMTAPWAMRHKWLKKKIAWWMFQRRDLKRAAAIHCTTELEVGWNKALGFNGCFVAPLGTEIKPLNTQNTRNNDRRVLLFVGRIHPVKGLENLIRAWGLAEPRNTLNTRKWVLRIVGPDEGGYLMALSSLVSGLGLDDSVEFAGPKYGEDLGREYEECDCLVLPSFTENFGATVVDAMAHGKPVITSTFTPWREVKERGCGWWVSNEPKKLSAAILEMMSLDDSARHTMGEAGRALVEEKYTWDAVAKKLESVYLDIIVRDWNRKGGVIC